VLPLKIKIERKETIEQRVERLEKELQTAVKELNSIRQVIKRGSVVDASNA